MDKEPTIEDLRKRIFELEQRNWFLEHCMDTNKLMFTAMLKKLGGKFKITAPELKSFHGKYVIQRVRDLDKDGELVMKLLPLLQGMPFNEQVVDE